MARLAYLPIRQFADLLAKASEGSDGYVRIVSENGLGVGPDPFRVKMVVDFSTEQVIPIENFDGAAVAGPPPGHAADRTMPAAKAARRSGDYWFELDGRKWDCGSLKQLLAESLKAIEKRKPGTLEKLSLVKSRTRRIVARDPKDLFVQGHLAHRYAEKLAPGWFYGTNNSAQQTNAWLERACRCAGLTVGQDFASSLTPSFVEMIRGLD